MVRNKQLVAAETLPTSQEIEKMYKKDPKMRAIKIEQILSAYEKKLEYFRTWQNE